MADFVSLVDSPSIISSASSPGAAVAYHGDDFEDACSICLEPFNSEDPPTVTSCRHEYHLHCILEWSQRSKECPICWQLLALKDPASQELLAAVENERILRSRRNTLHTHEDHDFSHDNSYADDSDFDERIMRHFAPAARRARYANRRGRQQFSGIGPSQVLLSVSTRDLPLSDMQHMHTTSPEESQRSSSDFSEGNSPTSSTSTTIYAQNTTSMVPDVRNMEPSSVSVRGGCLNARQQLPGSPPRPGSSEFLAFSESIKSKFSAASSRYKESISKRTQGFKEKLLARNVSVKELGKGVQREMNAGIANVARMIERLDLTSKRTGTSVPLASCPEGTANSSQNGKDMQESLITQCSARHAGETAHDPNSAAAPYVHGAIPGQLEAPFL